MSRQKQCSNLPPRGEGGMKEVDIFNLTCCSKLKCFSIHNDPYTKDGLPLGDEQIWTSQHAIFRARMKRRLIFDGKEMFLLILSNSFRLSRTMQTSIRQGLVTHNGPLCLWTGMKETSACSLEDCNIEEAVPTKYIFGKETAVGKVETPWYLARLEEDSKNNLHDTGEIYLSYHTSLRG